MQFHTLIIVIYGGWYFLFRPKRFTLKQSKQFWFTCRDLHLTLYKSREEAAQGAEPVHHINLRGCEVTPEVNITQGRYGIKLEVPSAEGMTEMFIRCNTVSVFSYRILNPLVNGLIDNDYLFHFITINMQWYKYFLHRKLKFKSSHIHLL
jgi:hypothetical protein